MFLILSVVDLLTLIGVETHKIAQRYEKYCIYAIGNGFFVSDSFVLFHLLPIYKLVIT